MGTKYYFLCVFAVTFSIPVIINDLTWFTKTPFIVIMSFLSSPLRLSSHNHHNFRRWHLFFLNILNFYIWQVIPNGESISGFSLSPPNNNYFSFAYLRIESKTWILVTVSRWLSDAVTSMLSSLDISSFIAVQPSLLFNCFISSFKTVRCCFCVSCAILMFRSDWSPISSQFGCMMLPFYWFPFFFFFWLWPLELVNHSWTVGVCPVQWKQTGIVHEEMVD